MSTNLVENHLPILRVSRGQEYLLALLVDLVDAWSEVWGEDTGVSGVPCGGCAVPCSMGLSMPWAWCGSAGSRFWALGGVNHRILEAPRGGGPPAEPAHPPTLSSTLDGEWPLQCDGLGCQKLPAGHLCQV